MIFPRVSLSPFCGLLSFLSGILLALAFPGFNLWWTAWFALLPLFYAIKRSENPRQAAGYGYLMGMPFYGITFAFILSLGEWVGSLILLGWLLLILLMSLYTALFAYLLKKCQGSFLLAPWLWVLIEWLRSLGPFGLVPSLGYTQWINLPLIQIASVTGVVGVSFFIVLVNALLAEVFLRKLKVVPIVAAVIIVVGLLVYGWLQIDPPRAAGEKGIMVALVQGNHGQSEKLDYSNLQAIKNDYLNLTRESLQFSPDLVVWPETSIPFYIQADPQYLDRIKQVSKADLILGLPRLDDQNRAYNSALFISEKGEVLGWVDKHHLVPFGEYMPFRPWLMPLFKQFNELKYTIFMQQDFSQGGLVEPVRTSAGRIGLGICSDSFFPAVFRDFVKQKADYFLIITNDGWYKGTSAYEKHLMVDVMRAVEFRKYLVQCANTGISAVIDPGGRVIERSTPDQREIIKARIYRVKSGSFYGRYGDWFIYLSLLILAGYFLSRLRPFKT